MKKFILSSFGKSKPEEIPSTTLDFTPNQEPHSSERIDIAAKESNASVGVREDGTEDQPAYVDDKVWKEVYGGEDDVEWPSVLQNSPVEERIIPSVFALVTRDTMAEKLSRVMRKFDTLDLESPRITRKDH